MKKQFFAMMTLALISGSAFAATPDAAITKPEINKADGKITEIKTDAHQVEKKDIPALKNDAQDVAKDLHQIKK